MSRKNTRVTVWIERYKAIAAICAVAAMSFCGMARGNIINIDLQPGGTGGGTSVTFSAQGALPSAGNTWNAFAPSTDGAFNNEFGSGGVFDFSGDPLTLSPVVDSTGGVTTVTMDLFKGDPDTGFALNPLNGSDGDIANDGKALMRDFIEATNPNSLNINGLVNGGLYTLYLYGAGDNSDRDTTFTIGGVDKSTTGVPGGSHNLTEGQDYVVFDNVVATGGFIGIGYRQADTSAGTGNFNGLQIMQVPEPTVAFLLAVGGLMVVRMLRRRVAL